MNMLPSGRLPLAAAALLSLVPLFVFPAFPLAPQQNVPKQAQLPYPETSERGNARIFYWGGDHSGGEMMIDYGRPAWKPEYAAQLDQMLGVRWRLGQNFWTHLDTNMDLAGVGLDGEGDIDVPAGLYYVALERKKEDKNFVLWLLDPTEIREQKLDAFQAPQTKGGIALPMTYTEVAKSADRLELRLDVDPKRKDVATLVVHFGTHQLTAALTMHPGK